MDLQEHMKFLCWGSKFNQIPKSFHTIKKLRLLWCNILKWNMDKISKIASDINHGFALDVIICICLLINVLNVLNVFDDFNVPELEGALSEDEHRQKSKSTFKVKRYECNICAKIFNFYICFLVKILKTYESLLSPIYFMFI